MRKDKIDLLEELQRANKENYKLQKNIVKLYEANRYSYETSPDSHFESQVIADGQNQENSQLFLNLKHQSLIDFSMNKPTEYYEDEDTPERSK